MGCLSGVGRSLTFPAMRSMGLSTMGAVPLRDYAVRVCCVSRLAPVSVLALAGQSYTLGDAL